MVLIADSKEGCIYKLNTLRPRQNRRHFADDIFKCIFFNENAWIALKISLKFVPKVRINNIPSLVQIMAWRQPGDRPLSEPMMVSLLTHISVTRPQWVKAWKAGMTSTGLCVNMKKTKFMVSGVGLDVLKKSTKYPCAVCCSGVSNNSIQWSRYMLWVHKKYRGIPKQLVFFPNYVCPRCKCKSWPRTMTEVDVDGTRLDVEDQITWNCSSSTAMTVPWYTGSVASKTERPSASLLKKLGIGDIMLVLCCRWLRRYGHVQLVKSCIKTITNFLIPSTRKQERPRKTWSECVKTDVNKCGLAGVGQQARDAWRAGTQYSKLGVKFLRCCLTMLDNHEADRKFKGVLWHSPDNNFRAQNTYW